MLLPCGISLFAGVEFVCCPKHPDGNVALFHSYLHNSDYDFGTDVDIHRNF